MKMTSAIAALLLTLATATILLGQAPTVPYLRRPRSGVVGGSFQTPAKVQTCRSGLQSSTTSFTCVLNSASVTANHLIAIQVVQSVTSSTVTVSDSLNGSITLRADSGSDNCETGGAQDSCQRIYYVVTAGGASDTITIACSPACSNAWAGAAELSGTATASPFDTSVQDKSSSQSGTFTSSTFTTTQANDYIFAAGWKFNCVPTVGTGYALLQDNTGANDIQEGKVETTATGDTASIVGSCTSPILLNVAAFKAAAL